ncbi:hypothetical protein V8C86DRAFT_2615833, partial [Haematococcus lacustris]
VMPGRHRPSCLAMATTGVLACLLLVFGVSAQLTAVPSAPSPPSPPLLAPRPPAPPLSTPLPLQSGVTRVELYITFLGLDLWSLVTSWGSGIQALL